MDTRLSSAVHALVMISEAPKPMSSEQIAQSIGTNASYVRRLARLLKGAGIVDARPGRAGFTLLVPAGELTLLAVYRAVCEEERVRLFDIHRNASDECVVGRHIRPVLGAAFRDVEERAEERLASMTLADVVAALREDAADDPYMQEFLGQDAAGN